MDDTRPAYYRRYSTDIGEVASESQVLTYLETLNLPDWSDLLSDVATGHARAMRVVQPRSRDELVGQAAALLQRNSPASHRIAGRALQQLIDHQVSGGEHFSVDQAHSLFSLAALLPGGIDVQRFATIANQPQVDAVYRDEAGRVIANHGAEVSVDLWKHLDLSLTPTLAPAVLLGLAAQDIQDAVEYVANVCREQHVSPAMKLAMRDVLQKCLREQGVGDLGRVVDVIRENDSLNCLYYDLCEDYPELLETLLELPSQTVRDLLEEFSDRVKPVDADRLEACLRPALGWLDDAFKLAESDSDEAYSREHVVNQMNSVLQVLHTFMSGDGKGEFLVAVCEGLLELRDWPIPGSLEVDLVQIASGRDWNSLSFRKLVEQCGRGDV